MKGFGASVLAIVPELLRRGLRRPVHLAFSYDEEIGCLGAPALVAKLVGAVPRPQAVIVGEPTDLEVADAHKSIYTYRTTVHGHEAHSSKPALGANAVMLGRAPLHGVAAAGEAGRCSGGEPGA